MSINQKKPYRYFNLDTTTETPLRHWQSWREANLPIATRAKEQEKMEGGRKISQKDQVWAALTFPKTGAMPIITEANAERTCWDESVDNS